ncbi:MAG: AAA family ATPase, partial [Chloroflexi bacterium]|nr:AAA family ATPase [Chloroflexota bacterium]
MFTLAIANHKGGVGKTATAHVLGAALAEMGQNVLLMDLDPQASLTGACGAGEVGASLADVLGGATPGRVALRDTILQVAERLYLAPSDISLATTELG